ncbi:hypothetical protein IQ07DRAFT_173125 [Pyrenochaeta sp. DS3sAY3a]|nr:hypothetical protein IQ07DRAFT_173125 [Pyrenochaeta sp. DS3sAY3a]
MNSTTECRLARRKGVCYGTGRLLASPSPLFFPSSHHKHELPRFPVLPLPAKPATKYPPPTRVSGDFTARFHAGSDMLAVVIFVDPLFVSYRWRLIQRTYQACLEEIARRDSTGPSCLFPRGISGSARGILMRSHGFAHVLHQGLVCAWRVQVPNPISTVHFTKDLGYAYLVVNMGASFGLFCGVGELTLWELLRRVCLAMCVFACVSLRRFNMGTFGN